MSSPGDYSFLLQTIEGDIDGISRKRSRTNIKDNTYVDNTDTINILNYSPDNNISDISRRRRSSLTNISVRDSAKTDELNILIEKLEDQLKSSIDENERLKERSERHITFLETENRQLKVSYDYYRYYYLSLLSSLLRNYLRRNLRSIMKKRRSCN
jgi:hypothetical protein